MLSVTHAPSCPSLPSGGARGACLCLPVSADAAPFIPHQTPRTTLTRLGRPVERERAAAVKAASAALRAANRRWTDARQWAVETERGGARALSASGIDPGTVTAYLAALAAGQVD